MHQDAPGPDSPLLQAEQQLEALRRERRHGLGLRWQVLLVLSVILSLTVLLIGVVVLRVNRDTLESQKVQEALTQSDLLAHATLVLLEVDPQNQRQGLERLVTAAVGQRGLGQMIIMDADLKVLAAAPGAVPSGVGPGAEVAACLYEGQQRWHMRSEGQQREIVVFTPLRDAQARGLGVISMRVPLQKVDALVERNENLLLLYLLLQSLLQLGVGYVLITRVVVRPVRAIAQATAAVADGDDSLQVRLRAANELGHLADDFNRMVRQLRQHRLTLERQVQDLEHANQELATAQRSLIRSEKLATVGTLAAGVAHEVGNPLAAVLGYIELLQEDWLEPEEARDLLRRTENELRRMDNIIRELLDYARPKPVEEAALALAPVVDNTLHLLANQPRLRQIQVHRELPQALALVRVDEGRLQQVLINLILNAADAMEGQGELWLRAWSDPEEPCVYLEVRDSGPGIPAEVMAQMFDPFFSTKAPGEGTGLGLAISQAIVEAFGGELMASSRPGQGASFTLRLPTVSPARQPEYDDPHPRPHLSQIGGDA